MTEKPVHHPPRGILLVLLAALLAAHAAMLAAGALLHSPTYNEPAHLAAGITYWRTGRFEQYPVNPPLAKLVAAAGVLVAGPRIPLEASMAHRDRLFDGEDPRVRDPLWCVSVARLFCIPFSLIGACVCYAWGRALYGTRSGLVAMVMWCFSPLVLGHGALVTSDVPGAALALAAAYAVHRWLKRKSWAGALAAGLAVGAALAVKFTSLVLLPVFVGVWLAGCWRAGAARGALRDLAQLAAAGAASLLVINTVYGWERPFVPLGEFEFSSRQFTGRGTGAPEGPGNRFAGTVAAALPVPVPANYLLGIDREQLDFDRGAWSYLRGRWQPRGWWYYYLYGLLVKEPLGYLAAGGLATWLRAKALRAARRWRAGGSLVAGCAAAVLLVNSLQTGFTSHVRYVLPALGFLYVWASQWAGLVQARRLALLLAGATVLGAASSLCVFPHSLAYFHELVGGPRQGHLHLLNSNFDWGQDLYYLRRWLDRHPEARPITLEYHGNVRPRAAGVDWRPAPWARIVYWLKSPEVRAVSRMPSALVEPPAAGAGWYAMSANLMHTTLPVSSSNLAQLNAEFARQFFAQFKPVASAGYSIWIFHLNEQEAARLQRLIEQSGAPPDEAGRRQAAGRNPQSSLARRAQG